MAEHEGIRLHVYLARCGLASRRKCEEMILEGLVKVDGKVIRQKGFKVIGEESIVYNGREMRLEKNLVYLALHKPDRFLRSSFDSQNRPLASELLPDFGRERLFHVGRLDFMSSGLIFYTNDGVFANKIMHPSSRVEKEYLVTTRDPVTKEVLDAFVMGVPIEGEVFTITSFNLKNPNTMHIVLQEGKNREIRKLFQYARIGVRKIHRVRIGQVRLLGLPPGQSRHLTKKEIASFYM